MSRFHINTLVTALLLAGGGDGRNADPVQPQSAARKEDSLPALADDPASAQPAEEVARLQKLWANWKLKASSIDVVGFEFIGVVGADQSKLSRRELIALIQETLPTTVKQTAKVDLATLAAATDAMFPPPPKGIVGAATFGRWSEFSMLREASNVRFDQVIAGRMRTTVRRGPIEQSFSRGSRQASVFTKNGGLRIPDMDTFIYGPKLPSASIVWRIQTTEPTKPRLIAEGDRGKANLLDYDAQSGFIEYHGLRLTEKQFHKERFQSSAVLTPDGIPIPRVVSEFEYNRRLELPDHICIYVLTTVEVGDHFEDSEFNLNVPAGTNVILFNGAPGEHLPGERPAMKTTTKAVDDAEQFTHSEEFQKAQKK
jgi:hypothetical protein